MAEAATGRDLREPARDARLRAARDARHEPALRLRHPGAVHPRLRRRRGHAARRRQQRAQRVVASGLRAGSSPRPPTSTASRADTSAASCSTRRSAAAQFQFFPGGASDPPGPGDNSAGLALFKYRTPCGRCLRAHRQLPGLHPVHGATRNGQASITVSINEQVSPTAGDPVVFQRLLKAEKTAVCTALARAR